MSDYAVSPFRLLSPCWALSENITFLAVALKNKKQKYKKKPAAVYVLVLLISFQMFSASPLPTFFLTHGGPNITVVPTDDLFKFLSGLGAGLRDELGPRIKAILVLSGHWETSNGHAVTSSPVRWWWWWCAVLSFSPRFFPFFLPFFFMFFIFLFQYPPCPGPSDDAGLRARHHGRLPPL